MKRALISVFDKTGIVEFSEFLISQGIEIISTGGTYRHLKENNIPVLDVAEVTQAEEMLDGRVKTLHPIIHGGILAVRGNEEHMKTLEERNITFKQHAVFDGNKLLFNYGDLENLKGKKCQIKYRLPILPTNFLNKDIYES